MHHAIKTLNNKIKEIESVRQYATGEERTKLSVVLYEHQAVLRLIEGFLNLDKKPQTEVNKKGVSHRKKVKCLEYNIEYESIKQAAKSIGITGQYLSDHLRGRYEKIKGLHFEYC